MSTKEIKQMLHYIRLRRNEIVSSPHPSAYRKEWLRLISEEVDLITELERRRAAADLNFFTR